MTTIAIIGTAGRVKTKHQFQTEDLYARMYLNAKLIILTGRDPRDLVLVSGGAAWADHLVVSLNKATGIETTLHLPAAWDWDKRQFDETSKDGRTANFYHRQFSQQIGRDSLASLDAALKRDTCKYSISAGFLARNKLVAHSKFIYAYTWAEGDTPADGGTAHTWNNAPLAIKRHIPLSQFVTR